MKNLEDIIKSVEVKVGKKKISIDRFGIVEIEKPSLKLNKKKVTNDVLVVLLVWLFLGGTLATILAVNSVVDESVKIAFKYLEF